VLYLLYLLYSYKAADRTLRDTPSFLRFSSAHSRKALPRRYQGATKALQMRS